MPHDSKKLGSRGPSCMTSHPWKRISIASAAIFILCIRNLTTVMPSLLKYATMSKLKHELNTNAISSSYPMQHESMHITEADLFKSACLWINRGGHHISYRNFFGSWDHKTSNRSHHDSLNLATVYAGAHVRAFDEIEENITSHAQTAWGISPANLPPMMYVPPNSHPAHCVQDVLFSLLPMAYRGDLRGVHAVTVNWHGDDYCTVVLAAMGWFEHLQTVPNNTCFDKLWVPAFMHYRFPRGRSRGVEFKNSNGYLHKEDLPIEMIQFFQTEMWKGLLSNNTFLDGKKGGIILFESRRGTDRRIWKNVDEIAGIVRERLGSKSLDVEIVDDMGKLTIKEQAAIYHRAAVLVTPHGGSNPNIVFMQPNTTVFEISCTGGSWAREWIIDLGIRHFAVLADAPPCNDHNEKFIAVQPKTLVEPIMDAYTNDTGREVGVRDGRYTTQLCSTLPTASVDTILWGAGEGDQGEKDLISWHFLYNILVSLRSNYLQCGISISSS